MSHIINLSDRFELKANNQEGGYLLTPLTLTRAGTYIRTTPRRFQNLDDVVAYLIRCELSQEDVTNLARCALALEGIKAELKELKALEVKWF